MPQTRFVTQKAFSTDFCVKRKKREEGRGPGADLRFVSIVW